MLLRYLDHAHHFPRWEMTDSEILAGIDGLFLAQKIAAWTNNSMRLRLSQVLDMYYSNRGLPFLSIENLEPDQTTPAMQPTASGRTKSTQSFTSDASITNTFGIGSSNTFRSVFETPKMHGPNDPDRISAQDEITSACSRRKILDSIDRMKLKDETYFLSQVLQFSTSSVAIPDRVLRMNCNTAVDKFFSYSSKSSTAGFQFNSIQKQNCTISIPFWQINY